VHDSFVTRARQQYIITFRWLLLADGKVLLAEFLWPSGLFCCLCDDTQCRTLWRAWQYPHYGR